MTRKASVKVEGGHGYGFLPVWLALGTGILLFLSFPGAAGWWPVAWVALVPLLLAVRGATVAGAVRLGLIAGMVHYVSLLYWIVIVLGKYGHLPIWVSLPALLLLALYMSSYLALFSVIISRAWHQRESLIVWVGPFLWVGLDYLRSFLFSGFPWQDLGYSQYRALLLIQTADLTGHFGITYHIVLVNSVTALLLILWLENRSGQQAELPIMTLRLRRAWFQAVLPSLIIILLVLLYNVFRYHQVSGLLVKSSMIKTAVVQGNIEQDQKWSPAMRLKTMEIYTKLSDQAMAARHGPPTLLVWPETAIPFVINDNPYFNRLKNNLLAKRHVWLLAGAPYYKEVEAAASRPKRKILSYNSAYLFRPAGEVVGRYDKQHLVPFGEYIPLSDYLPLPGPLVENIGNFSSGEPGRPLPCQSAAIGVLICFESIFPKLARDWTANGANMLVNITNDAWFGRSSAPWQHLSMAVLRSVENRRSLVRSANTGVSAFVDPLGRITGASHLFQPFFGVAAVPLLQVKTVFVYFGHYFGLLCLLVCIPLAYHFRKAGRHGM